jgi:hypothetical protein
MRTAHILLTRFNLATPGRERLHRVGKDWLRRRFDLFELYCLPSIAAQDTNDFLWLIFFDIDTPDWARERIEKQQKFFPFQPVFTELFKAEGWARNVRTAIGPAISNRIVITSNLDNDDGLAKNYLSRVRKMAEAHWRDQTFAINVPDGYVLNNGKLYFHRHLHNAFTNLVEADGDALQTTKTIRHMELATHVPIVQAEGPPGWLQVVHDGNVSNKIRGSRVPLPTSTDFTPELLTQLTPVSNAVLFWDNRVCAPLRSTRDLALKLGRRLIPADRTSHR